MHPRSWSSTLVSCDSEPLCGLSLVLLHGTPAMAGRSPAFAGQGRARVVGASRPPSNPEMSGGSAAEVGRYSDSPSAPPMSLPPRTSSACCWGSASASRPSIEYSRWARLAHVQRTVRARTQTRTGHRICPAPRLSRGRSQGCKHHKAAKAFGAMAPCPQPERNGSIAGPSPKCLPVYPPATPRIFLRRATLGGVAAASCVPFRIRPTGMASGPIGAGYHAGGDCERLWRTRQRNGSNRSHGLSLSPDPPGLGSAVPVALRRTSDVCFAPGSVGKM